MSDTQTPRNTERVISCGGCTQKWSGRNRSHCAAPGCHRTFSGESAADKHRVGAHGVDRRCADPAKVGLIAREYQLGTVWGWPSPDEDRTATWMASLGQAQQ